MEDQKGCAPCVFEKLMVPLSGITSTTAAFICFRYPLNGLRFAALAIALALAGSGSTQ